MVLGMSSSRYDELVRAALDVRKRAYAPYSKFKVGAALRSDCGAIFVGCNVENISYGLTNCAERVAIGNAVAGGSIRFSAIAIVADTADPIAPCGACRQVLSEFGDLVVVMSTVDGVRSDQATVRDLLPLGSRGILDFKDDVPRGTFGGE